MEWILGLAAVAAGVVIGLQSGVNARLGTQLGHPLVAALTSFTIGGTTLLILCLGLRLPLPSREQWTAPWWVWTGGLLGAAFVTAQATLPTRLGVTAFVVLVVAGQLLIALVMDQFGWLDLQVRPVTVQKLIGVVLLVAAVVLIRM